MPKTLSLTLPWPPSVNHYYGHNNGHIYLKEAGRLYRRKAVVEFARMGWPRFGGRVAARIILMPPDNRKRDIDNPLKAVMDAISDSPHHKGVIADDALIRELMVKFAGVGGEQFPGRVEITLSELAVERNR